MGRGTGGCAPFSSQTGVVLGPYKASCKACNEFSTVDLRCRVGCVLHLTPNVKRSARLDSHVDRRNLTPLTTHLSPPTSCGSRLARAGLPAGVWVRLQNTNDTSYPIHGDLARFASQRARILHARHHIIIQPMYHVASAPRRPRPRTSTRPGRLTRCCVVCRRERHHEPLRCASMQAFRRQPPPPTAAPHHFFFASAVTLNLKKMMSLSSTT